MHSEEQTRRRGRKRWSESEVDSQFPSTAFNFSKPLAPANIFEDAHDVIAYLPCRILNNWYLVEKPNPLGYYFSRKNPSSAFPSRRCPLPIDTLNLHGFMLRGTLQPQHPSQEPIKVELADLDFYTIDSTRGYRGFWVVTDSAKYWLHNPCSKTFTIPRLKISIKGEYQNGLENEIGTKVTSVDSTLSVDCSHELPPQEPDLGVCLPSQEQLHQLHRAFLGLLSNLIDIFILPDYSYNWFLHNLTLDQIHDLLTPSDMAVWNYHKQLSLKTEGTPKLFKHPFDLALCKSSPLFLPYVQAIHPAVEKSTWFRDLQKNSIINLEGSVNTGVICHTQASEDYWISSAEKAENRSLQLPTGQSRSDKQIPNLLYPIDLELHYLRETSKRVWKSWVNDSEDWFTSSNPLPPLPGVSEQVQDTPILLDSNDKDPTMKSKSFSSSKKRSASRQSNDLELEPETSLEPRVPRKPLKKRMPQLSTPSSLPSALVSNESSAAEESSSDAGSIGTDSSVDNPQGSSYEEGATSGPTMRIPRKKRKNPDTAQVAENVRSKETKLTQSQIGSSSVYNNNALLHAQHTLQPHYDGSPQHAVQRSSARYTSQISKDIAIRESAGPRSPYRQPLHQHPLSTYDKGTLGSNKTNSMPPSQPRQNGARLGFCRRPRHFPKRHGAGVPRAALQQSECHQHNVVRDTPHFRQEMGNLKPPHYSDQGGDSLDSHVRSHDWKIALPTQPHTVLVDQDRGYDSSNQRGDQAPHRPSRNSEYPNPNGFRNQQKQQFHGDSRASSWQVSRAANPRHSDEPRIHEENPRMARGMPIILNQHDHSGMTRNQSAFGNKFPPERPFSHPGSHPHRNGNARFNDRDAHGRENSRKSDNSCSGQQRYRGEIVEKRFGDGQQYNAQQKHSPDIRQNLGNIHLALHTGPSHSATRSNYSPRSRPPNFDFQGSAQQQLIGHSNTSRNHTNGHCVQGASMSLSCRNAQHIDNVMPHGVEVPVQHAAGNMPVHVNGNVNLAAAGANGNGPWSSISNGLSSADVGTDVPKLGISDGSGMTSNIVQSQGHRPTDPRRSRVAANQHSNGPDKAFLSYDSLTDVLKLMPHVVQGAQDISRGGS